MKLTVDSSEPLEDAMRVLGALYGVTLVISSEAPDGKAPAQPRTRRRTRAAPTKSRTGAPAGAGVAGQSRKGTAARSAGSASNAEVRAWARRTGLTVRDRGRVPASVLNAYRDAHNE